MENGDTGAINQAIARNYDQAVYDPQPNPLLDPHRLLGLAALFGEVSPPRDVLDIGCGTGVQLAQAAPFAPGRLAGTDISAQACGIARERLAPFGERAAIDCRDLLALDENELGQFDLIFNVGVIYVTPSEVQAKILSMIGRCLRPGGIAVMSYYAGTVPMIRASLHRTLRRIVEGLPRDQAISRARAELAAMAGQQTGDSVLQAAIKQTAGQGDLIFFHEVLNHAFDAMQTSQIESALAAHGLEFTGYLGATGMERGATSRDRAVLADVVDLAQGGYRYALFARHPEPGKADVTRGQVEWETPLRREARGQFDGELRFTAPGNVNAGIKTPATAALIDALAGGPLGWAKIKRRVGAAMAAAGLPFGAAEAETMKNDLAELWRLGLATPLFAR